MNIHPTAIVSKHADIDSTAEIGPYVIVEEDVTIRKKVKIYAHAYICNGTYIDEETQIHMGAVIGHVPQDLAFKNRLTYLKIGKKNIIREYVTIHRGTEEGTATKMGDENFLMALSHVGHNCNIGNRVIVANGALLGGYVNVGDQVFISGNVVVHQFCNIGRLAMIGGFSAVNTDVPPYVILRGPSRVRSINIIGLRRAGFKSDVIRDIRSAFRQVYVSGLTVDVAIGKILERNPGQEVRYFVEFIRNSKKGIGKHGSRANWQIID